MSLHHLDLNQDTTIYRALYELPRPVQEEEEDTPAVIDAERPDHRLSFGQLRSLVHAYAATLQHRFGLAPGQVVAICSPNQIEYPAALHAIAAIGCVGAAISKDYTTEMIAYCLKLADVQLVLGHPETADKVHAAMDQCGLSRDKMVLLGPDLCCCSDKPPDLAGGLLDPDATAYLYCTSGTTGNPKMVTLSHRAVLASARHRANQLMGKKPWRPKTRVFMACNPASNAGPCVLDYHAVIWCGVPLYVMPRFDVPSFCRNVERYKVEACLIAPWVVAACLANDPPTGGQAYDLSSLRWVSAAGSRVEPQIVRRAKERIGVDVLNEYGQTEILCMFDFDEPGLIEKAAVGRPIPGSFVKLVNDKGEVGRTGELCVRGPTVTKGYYHLPEATASLFDSEGFLRTGDLFTMDDKGVLWFIDRKKDLIKYLLYHIYPKELEDIIATYPGVQESCVVGKYLPREGTELPRAYVVMKQKPPAEKDVERQIQEYVDSRVADYKRLRAGVKIVDALPRGQGLGKVDRRLLRQLANEERLAKL